jgi:hypothetical protein
MIAEIGKFTILIGKFKRDRCNYGRRINLAKVAKEVERRKVPTQELAETVRGRVNLYDEYVQVYVEYILEESEKVDRIMTEEKRKLINDFIVPKVGNYIIGVLLAIYRIRNNLFHSIKK